MGYIVVTIRKWNIKIYNDVIQHYPGNWYLITRKEDLTIEKVKSLNPQYIFFPHWNYRVPEEILNITNCICFHETDLPYGRGGSPIQNLINKGHTETVITALKMVEKLDAGPIYLKLPLSLEGLAEEIYIRISKLVAEMIRTIITQNPIPKEQKGGPELFERRNPKQSRLDKRIESFQKLFDFIRMLDANEYPKAFFDYGNFRFELSRPALKTDEILADVRITKLREDE